MAAPTRSIRIKFDGTAKGLLRAANDAARGIDRFGDDVERKSGRFGKVGAKLGVSFGAGMFSVMSKLPTSLTRLLTGAGPGLGIAGGVVGAGITTLIGGAIAGAIGGAVGTAAIAAGIASAADSPKVQAAWGLLVGDLKLLRANLADAFAEPTARSIGILRKSLAAVRDDMDEIGRISARWVGPLSEGLGGFLERAVAGLRHLLARLDPVFAMLQRELPELGDDVKQFFTDIGAGAKGGAEALAFVLDVAGAAIVSTGKILGALGQAYDVAEDLSRIVTKPGFGLLTVVDENRPRKLIKGLKSVGVEAGAAARQVRELSEAFEDWLNLGLSAEEAADRFRLELLELDDAIAENGRSLSDASEGGLKNQQVIRGMIRLAGEQRRAEIERGQGTEEAIAKANAAYQANIAKIIEVGVKAGLSRAELEKLAGSYGINIYLTGLEKIRDQLRALGAAASVVPGLGGAAIGFNLAQGIVGAAIPRAMGGPTIAGRTYLVGERGPELLRMGSQSGHIVPNHQLAGGAPEVRVFIGERELTDIVRVEVREHDRGLKRRALAGAGAR